MSFEFYATVVVGSIASVIVTYQFLGDQDCFRLVECCAKLCCRTCIKKSRVPSRPPTIEIPPPMYISSTRQRVILITDIGRDTDGPLALIALANNPRIELAGIITTGGNTVNRARTARYWLRMCGIQDEDCFVVPDYSKVDCIDVATRKRLNNCQVPLSADTANNSALYRCSRDDAVALLVAEVTTWKEHVHIMCFASTTTLADAFECNSTAMNQVGKIIMPGSVVEPLSDQVAVPVLDYDSSHSIAEDYRSTDYVFEMCASGSNAKIHVIDESLGQEYRLGKLDVEHICNYILTVRDTYKYIMDTDYEQFCEEHSIPKSTHPSTWFNHIQHVCIPSKTLAVLAYIEPHWFAHQTTQHRTYTATKKGKYRKGIKERLLECIEVKGVFM